MKPISDEALQLLTSQSPQFISTVQRTRIERKGKKRPVAILATLDAFADDPMLLYAALWYANTERVSVTFVATERTK